MNNRFMGRAKPAQVSHSLMLSAAGAILILWVATIGLQALIQTGRIAAPASKAIEFLPGLLGLAVLFAVGFTPGECFLRFAPLSRKGLLALTIPLPLMLPVILYGTWQGWDGLKVLVYAPAGALSQVLFFRCVLLPLLLNVLKNRPLLAIFLAALMHGLWHVGPLAQGYPWYASLPVMGVPFLAGLAWNWQVCHDRTVLWVSIYHILVDQAIILFYG